MIGPVGSALIGAAVLMTGTYLGWYATRLVEKLRAGRGKK